MLHHLTSMTKLPVEVMNNNAAASELNEATADAITADAPITKSTLGEFVTKQLDKFKKEMRSNFSADRKSHRPTAVKRGRKSINQSNDSSDTSPNRPRSKEKSKQKKKIQKSPKQQQKQQQKQQPRQQSQQRRGQKRGREDPEEAASGGRRKRGKRKKKQKQS